MRINRPKFSAAERGVMRGKCEKKGAIESGAPGQQPPAFVQSIQNGKVTLDGDVGSLGLGNEASFEGDAVVDGNEELAALMCDLKRNNGVRSPNSH